MLENKAQERLTHEHSDLPMCGTAGMKKCPFCAELIQQDAVKCRYCGEFLDGSAPTQAKKGPTKWYYATGTIVIALLCLGPLALPLVWLNRRYRPTTKVFITGAVLVATVACTYWVIQVYENLLEQFEVFGI